MGLIEQAVELLQRTNAPEPAGQPAQASPRIGTPEPRPQEPSSVAPASEDRLTVPCRDDRVVRIDLQQLRGAGLLAPGEEERRLASEYRMIKRPLLAAMGGDARLGQGNVVVVTSALPGEGKTFTSINLALSLALERDRAVVLVDGDVAKAHMTQLFGLEGQPGFLDLGDAERGLEDTILRTDHPSLYFLPAGTMNAEATEILRSDRMASQLASLAADPRLITLIDAPPLLVTSEATVVTSLAGQVIVVVKAMDTTHEAVARAIETISEDRSVSLVLNQADADQAPGYGYYYGQYGYGRTDAAAAGAAAPGSREQ